ncbi:serine O-acetyltransferase [Bacteroidia bacterium]|nr:serine O-acetyltransferase [Bacteroidia bacterium]
MIQSKQNYLSYLNADESACGKKKKSLKNFFFPDLVWQFQKSLRRYEYYTNVKRGLLGNILQIIAYSRYRRLSLKLGFSIPKNVFGPGLSIAHYGTIVINPATRIGKNCRIHASVNIGASGGSPKAPQIGDNVYIGPGAIIFGDISIADNVSIGANATVNKSIETPNCIVAGSPAKIVKENVSSWCQAKLI